MAVTEQVIIEIEEKGGKAVQDAVGRVADNLDKVNSRLQDANGRFNKAGQAAEEVADATDKAADATEEWNEALSATERQIREIRQETERINKMAANSQLVRALQQQNKAQAQLERKTMTFGQRMQTNLEVAENLTGAIDLAALGVQAVVAAWKTLDFAMTARGAASLARQLEQVTGEIRRASESSEALFTDRQRQGQAIVGNIQGVSQEQQASIRDLSAALGRQQAAQGAGQADELAAEMLGAITAEIQSGQLGPALSELGVTAGAVEREQAKMAEQLGIAVEGLTQQQRARALENAATLAAARSTSLVGENLDGLAKLLTILKNTANSAATGFLDFADTIGRGAGLIFNRRITVEMEREQRIQDAQEAFKQRATGAINAFGTGTEATASGRDSVENADQLLASRAELLRNASMRLEIVQAMRDAFGETSDEAREIETAANETVDELTRAVAAQNNISREEARQLVLRANSEVLAANAERLEGQRLAQLRARLAGERQLLEDRIAEGRYQTQAAKAEAEAQIAVLKRREALAQTVDYAEEYFDLVSDGQFREESALEAESKRLAVLLQAKDTLSTSEQDALALAAAMNQVQLNAARATDNAADYQTAVANGAVNRALSVNRAQWGELLAAVGFTADEIKEATASTDAFSVAVKQVVASGGLVDLLKAVVTLTGDKPPGGRRGGRGFDIAGFRQQLTRELEDTRIALAQGQAEIAKELMMADSLVWIMLTGGDDRLEQHLTNELAQNALTLERWRTDQIEKARGDAEAIAAIEAIYVARQDALAEQLRSQAFQAGLASLADFARGAAEAAESGVMEGVFGEDSAARAQMLRDVETSRLNRQSPGSGDRAVRMTALQEEADERLRLVRGNAEAEIEILRWLLEEKKAIMHEGVDAARDARDREIEATFGQLDEIRSRADVITAEMAKDQEKSVGVAVGTMADGLFEMAAVGRDLSLQQAAIQADLAKGNITGAQASVQNASHLVGAFARVTGSFLKSQRAQAAVGGAMEIAKAASAFATPGGQMQGGLHLAAAAKFFAAAALAGGGGGGSASADTGGAAAAAAARRNEARTAASVQGAADIRGITAPEQITINFTTSMDPLSGEAIIEQANAVSQRGGTRQLDANLIGNPRRRDR